MILGHGKKVETAALGGKSNTLPVEAATGSLADDHGWMNLTCQGNKMV
tara:strand:+ start:1267 stop:1410 length:144 start_codon:yes stop_codon:yes gene_type:complete